MTRLKVEFLGFCKTIEFGLNEDMRHGTTKGIKADVRVAS